MPVFATGFPACSTRNFLIVERARCPFQIVRNRLSGLFHLDFVEQASCLFLMADRELYDRT
ncbi:hypothetical protein QUA20_30860 [Microcoleus sp. Pol7_A1]|uniref:hypothetical protein n=1 Tax=Microcoleus sp. Pol7_A1 TaxID=2818893 RepID=UPI002FCF2848